jgi:hypothetical protein
MIRSAARAVSMALASSLMLAGCVGVGTERLATADRIAAGGGLARTTYATPSFRIAAWERLARPAETVSIYLEGDGAAFVVREPAMDPTPERPVALALAAVDPAPAVVYIARPCQYREAGATGDCELSVWASQRLGEPVVRAIDAAISQAKARAGATRIDLVGFSSGGGMAALLAARRNDIASLRTVAGLLHWSGFNQHHGVRPRAGSLDPINAAPRLAALPQIHYVGGADRAVPPMLAEGFRRQAGDGRCIEVVTLPGQDHEEGWERRWRALLARPPACR